MRFQSSLAAVLRAAKRGICFAKFSGEVGGESIHYSLRPVFRLKFIKFSHHPYFVKS